MKEWILKLVLAAGMTTAICAQQPGGAVPIPQRQRVEAADLPRFDLDFPGGPPQELVRALNVPLKGSLNVVLPDDVDDIMIPPIKLKQVTVQQVFDALQRTSERRVSFYSGGGMSQQVESYFFSTTQPPTENSVWAFQANRPITLGKSTALGYRFYQLGSYLDSMKIEDIITALQTGWEMLNRQGAKLKFHPETKLLIAVGQPNDFALIDDVLKELAKAPRGAAVSFSGEVRQPGSIPLLPDKRFNLMGVLERAGGVTPDADTNKIRLFRPGQGLRVLNLGEANDARTIIESGDEIIVSKKQ